jgi:hypothetical protein
LYKQSKFEKAKRDSETKYDSGSLYNNPEEIKLWFPNIIIGYGLQPKIAHPKFKRALFYIIIGIVVLYVVATLIY